MNRKRWTFWNQLRNQQRVNQRTLRGKKRNHERRVRIEPLEQRQLLAADFTLELLHIADQEAAVSAIQDAPRLSAVLNSLRAEDIGEVGEPDNTLTLSSGDAFIPGLFFNASEPVFGSAGIADIQIQNELGIQAITLGNHEFDFGTEVLADLIDGTADGDFAALTSSDLAGQDFTGANFPYLSANLDFSTDPNLAPLESPFPFAPTPNSVTSSVVIDVNGEAVGVVGATTPTLASISSPGTIGISPSPFDASPSDAQLDALAVEIQSEVDALLAANPDIDKVILLAHMQQLDIERALAERLTDVDIIVGGGSNTRLFDDNDRPRDGDSPQGEYPEFIENAGGTITALVNTDGSYKYVGRLVIGFDEFGNIDPSTYDATVSGAYATDDQGVADLAAEGLIDPEIQAIVGAIEQQIIATESNVFGISDVFLNGNRSGTDSPADPDGVRTQETNLGNLTADANLAEAQKSDSSVVISLKNGGGIRASIGQTVVPAGGTDAVRSPNEAVTDSDGNLIKPEGGISQNDIETTLAFNNGLALLTLTTEEVVGLLEHGVGAIPGVSGRFPQISGLKLSYDPSLPEGERVINAAVFDEEENLVAPLVRDGQIVNPEATLRVVTLGFLAAPRFNDSGDFIGGGDGYPFPNTNTDPSKGEVGDTAVISRINFVSLEQEGVTTGDAMFADDGTEQDALAEYLDDNFADQANAFTSDDTGRNRDQRIQNLAFRPDTVYPVRGTLRVTNNNDSGEGSFREAVQIASENPGVDRIVVSPRVDEIVLESAVEYFGTQELKIVGNNVELIASDNFVGAGVFVSSAAADLILSRLTVDGDFEDGETLANGIFIPVPGDATGKVSLTLDRVTVKNTALHGVHIADQLEDSPAGVSLTMRRSTIINNGIGTLDFDGVRVDEGGDGDLHASIRRSRIDANGGDGLELDERGDGDVDAFVSETSFNDNGFFDQDYDPENPPIGDDGEIRDEQDLDDGFDIDEAGDGGIKVRVVRSEAVNNYDEGFDFDEEDAGGISMVFDRVLAEGNSDEGIKAGEEDEGGIFARLSRIEVIDNGDDDLSVEQDGGEGLQISEEDEGSFYARLSRIEAVGNGSEGLKIEEEGEGSLTANLSRVEAESNGDTGVLVEESDEGGLIAFINRLESEDNDGNGLEVIESDAGNFFGRIARSEFEDNEGFGLVAKQEDNGFGLLILRDVESEDNEDGPADIDGLFLLGDLED